MLGGRAGKRNPGDGLPKSGPALEIPPPGFIAGSAPQNHSAEVVPGTQLPEGATVEAPVWSPEKRRDERTRALAGVINSLSMENMSGTPDWLLGEFLMEVLEASARMILRRDKWYSQTAGKWTEAPLHGASVGNIDCPVEPIADRKPYEIRDDRVYLDKTFARDLLGQLLAARAAAGLSTPEETYGYNIAWAIREAVAAIEQLTPKPSEPVGHVPKPGLLTPLTKPDIEQLKQCLAITWDGNLMSKHHRDVLVNMGAIARTPDGGNIITPLGVQWLKDLGSLRDISKHLGVYTATSSSPASVPEPVRDAPASTAPPGVSGELAARARAVELKLEGRELKAALEAATQRASTAERRAGVAEIEARALRVGLEQVSAELVSHRQRVARLEAELHLVQTTAHQKAMAALRLILRTAVELEKSPLVAPFDELASYVKSACQNVGLYVVEVPTPFSSVSETPNVRPDILAAMTGAPEPDEEDSLLFMAKQYNQPDRTLMGEWRVANGLICNGTLRIARFDFDTSPSHEMQLAMFRQIGWCLNTAYMWKRLADLKDAKGEANRQHNNELKQEVANLRAQLSGMPAGAITPPTLPKTASIEGTMNGVFNVLSCVTAGQPFCPSCGCSVTCDPNAFHCDRCTFRITMEEYSNAIVECLPLFKEDLEAWSNWRDAFHEFKDSEQRAGHEDEQPGDNAPPSPDETENLNDPDSVKF
jgi:hypothetical protein